MSIDLNKIGYTPQVKRQRDIVGTPADVSAEAQAAGIGASADASIFGTLAKVGANVGSSIESESRRRERNRALLERQEKTVQKAITDSEEQFVRNRWTNLKNAENDILQTAITEDKTNFANWGKGGENDFLSRYELNLNNFFKDETLLALLTKPEHEALFTELTDQKNNLIYAQKQSLPLKAGAAVIEINQDNILTTVDDAIKNINTDLPTNMLFGQANLETRAAAVLEIINESDILPEDKRLEITGEDNKILEKDIQEANIDYVVSARPDEAIKFLSQSLLAKEQGNKDKDLFPEFSSKEIFTALKAAQGNLNTIQTLTNDDLSDQIATLMGADGSATQENLAERKALKTKIKTAFDNNQISAQSFETLTDKLDLENNNDQDMATLMSDILKYDPANDKTLSILADLTERVEKFEGAELELLKGKLKEAQNGKVQGTALSQLIDRINIETRISIGGIQNKPTSILAQELDIDIKSLTDEVKLVRDPTTGEIAKVIPSSTDFFNFRALATRVVTEYMRENPYDYQGGENLYLRLKQSHYQLSANKIFKDIFAGQADDTNTTYIDEGYKPFSAFGLAVNWKDLDEQNLPKNKEETEK